MAPLRLPIAFSQAGSSKLSSVWSSSKPYLIQYRNTNPQISANVLNQLSHTRMHGVSAHTGFPRTLTITNYTSAIFSTLNPILSVINLSRLECAETPCIRVPYIVAQKLTSVLNPNVTRSCQRREQDMHRIRRCICLEADETDVRT